MTDADPFTVLGVSPGASDDEVRAAYRRMVHLHHPDHNGGSLQSTRAFEEIQSAYAEIRRRRGDASGEREAPRTDRTADSRIEELERQLREERAARERARAAARAAVEEAAAAAAATNAEHDRRRRPSDEDLGYVTTDDSFSKIIGDAAREFSGLYTDARESPIGKTLEDLVEDVLDRVKPRPPDGGPDQERRS